MRPDSRSKTHGWQFVIGVMTPRIPRQSQEAMEDQTTARVCVSPQVWLCALAGIVQFGRLHVYIVDAQSMTEPLPNLAGKLSDFINTGEKWITDNDIAVCGGEIEMNYLGFINFNQDLEYKLRRFVGCPVLPSVASDDGIWNITDARFELRDEVNGFSSGEQT